MATTALMLTLLCAVGVAQLACAPAAARGSEASAGTSAGAVQQSTTSTDPPSVEITIAAAGDLMIHRVTARAARAAGGGDAYDFRPTFASVAPYLSAADYTVVNLETRMAGPEFVYASFPRFNCPDSLTDALTLMGVDLCATANNHALDKEWVGLVNTLDRLDEAGIAHVGTYRSAEEKAVPLIVDIKGIKVAFINYTDILNIHHLPREYAVDYLTDRGQMVAEVRAARAAGADVVIALMHWGLEYVTKPNPGQRSLALGSEDCAGLLSSGVDVILGAHPHVVQPAQWVPVDTPSGPKNSYVVYSMGNFSSDMVRWRTDSGVIVYVHVRRTGQKVEVTGLEYMAVYMQQYGSYPRKVVVEPLLPGVVPAPGSVSAAQQRRLDSVWEYVTDMYHDPQANILPLDPSHLNPGVAASAGAD